MSINKANRIACIPDLHCPYVSKSKITLMFDALKELKPNIIIQLGDLYDFISQSRFPKGIKHFDSLTEVTDGRIVAEEIWSYICKNHKKAAKYQILGNHDIRPVLRMVEKSPELEPFVDIKKFFEFDGVKTIHDPKETLEIDGIVFTHGHLTKIGDHARSLLKPVCHGHTHRGHVQYYRLHEKIIWELSCGYLADPFHEALVYRPLVKYFNWHHGFGFIDSDGPRFISL